MIKLYCSCLKLDEEYVEMILKWTLNRINKLSDLVKNEFAFIWVIPSTSITVSETQLTALRNFMNLLESMDSLEKEKLKDSLMFIAKESNIKYATFMKTLRALLSGLKVR